MREKIVRCAQVCVLGAVVVLLAQPAWGVLNNGFETDYVYVTRYEENAPGTYEIRAHNESDGAEMFRLAPPGDWLSITFSGTGTNDAWLYALGTVDDLDVGDPDDILVARLDSTGATQDSVLMSTLLGGSPGIYGSTLSMGNIRFSSYYPNHVFVSAVSDASGSLRGMVWKLDLALDTLAATYVGPPVPTPSADDLRTLGIDINDNDGSIYMCGQHLNQAADDNKGDLVKFTSLTTWEVLVDGDNYSAGDTRWASPRCPIFRGSNPDDGTPTVVIPMNLNSNGDPALEFYLDTGTHPKVGGNLECRGSPIFLARGQWGQQDSLNTALWIGTIRNGIAILRPDDVGAIYQGGWNWHDCDSPPYSGDLAPKIYEVSPDPISVAEGTDYEKQLYLIQGKPAPTWSLAQGPAGATIDGNGKVSGWHVTASDIGPHTFEAVATTIGLGSDSEVWTVNVPAVNNGFFTDHIYVALSGQIRVHQESDATWIKDFPTDGTNSLTFSGKGTTDARLFTAQDSPAGAATDIIINELDDEGTVVNSANLSTLLGASVGPAVGVGSIRYGEFSNTLFISANTNTAASNPAMAWEVDLELTNLIATFTGPDVTSRMVNVAVNPQDGTLYMSGDYLGDPTSTGLGDLVAFDTTGGSTTSYTTLIKGSTENQVYSNWNRPSAPIYRGPNNPSERPTILILTNWQTNAAPVMEYYLDETVPFDPPETPPINAGNLLQRGTPTTASRGWRGQLDLFSKDVWIAELRWADWGVLHPDDTSQRWRINASPYREYTDIASPPYGLCNVPFADADGDLDVDQDDFAVFQICFTGEQPLHPPIPASPFYCGCFDRESGGDATDDIDTKDFNAFQACATGPGIHFDPDNPPGACVP